MNAAKDAGEEYYEPACEDNILERNKTRLAVWEVHLKDPIVALDKALKCVENSYWRSWPGCFVEGVFAMAGVGVLQSLWEKPMWEGVWPCLDPMDSVCLRTASMAWNVPGKYGPHGDLFFFLIRNEPASTPGSETFSTFFNADIRTLLFSPDVLKKCALIALYVIEEQGRDGDGCHVSGLLRAQCGRVKAKLGRKTKVCLQVGLGTATWVTVRCTSSGCAGLVARSLFSCRIGSYLDMLCQEMHEAW